MRIWVYLAFALLAMAAEPQLIHYATPGYPPLARQARIMGTVELEYSIDPAGKTTNVQVISGHPLLVQASASNLQTWIFKLESLAETGGRRRVQFAYDLTAQPEKVEVVFDGSARVIVRFAPLLADRIQTSGCPSGPPTLPSGKIGPTDSVTLWRSGCYGTCPAYEVKVFGDGRYEWDGKAFVAAIGKRSGRIPEAEAVRLLERFRTSDVWSLCDSYSQSVTDNPTYLISLAFEGATKTIEDYADSSPTWFQELQDAVDETVNTHALRHGDAATEALSNIDNEYFPKPGQTEWIRAVIQGDLDRVRSLVQSGVDVNAADASGWTALMYAVGNYQRDEIVVLLLQSGVKASHQTPYGDTVLMAAALADNFDRELAKLGGNINAQNRDGVTALMLLAVKADPEQIEDALLEGANAKLRDSRGRTALDYLEKANCDENLIRGHTKFLEFSGRRRCDALDEDDYKKAKQLLRKAMRKR